MLKVEVLSIGTELLMGQIANTNAQYISRKLPEIGLAVYYHSVVGDNPKRIKEALEYALSRVDVVITTGGLGPTMDDLTKEIVSETLGLPLILNEKCKERIRKYFEDRGRVLVQSNFKQAYFPEGSIILENDMGTAPGCIVETASKTIVLLPGPPHELNPMFDKFIDYYKAKTNNKLLSKFIRLVGLGESLVEEKIMDLVKNQTNPTLATYAKDGIVTIRVTASDENGQDPALLLEDTTKKIISILGDNIYTTDNEDLEYHVFNRLLDKDLKIAIAESCSGGVLSEMITSIPGSSKVFLCGAVTYSVESKMSLLSVNKSTIDTYGAVSRETAKEMAEGICNKTGADIGVSITGFAGPEADFGKAVGLVYIGVSYKGETEVKEFNLSGNRLRIRTLSAIYALDMVRRRIN